MPCRGLSGLVSSKQLYSRKQKRGVSTTAQHEPRVSFWTGQNTRGWGWGKCVGTATYMFPNHSGSVHFYTWAAGLVLSQDGGRGGDPSIQTHACWTFTWRFMWGLNDAKTTLNRGKYSKATILTSERVVVISVWRVDGNNASWVNYNLWPDINILKPNQCDMMLYIILT